MKQISIGSPTGVCQIFCKFDNQLDKVTLTVDDEITVFFIAFVWINCQPAKCLKDYNFRKINQNAVIHYKLVNEEIHISFPTEDDISLQIIDESRDPFVLLVSPQLTGFGLRLMIERRCDRKDFHIFDQDNSHLEEFLKLDEVCQMEEDIILTIKDREDLNIYPLQDGEEGGFGFSLTPFVNFKDKIHLNISQKAPIWRTIDKGFNLEGRCLNKKCLSFIQNSYVCIEKQFGEFHISEACCDCICPACKEPMIDSQINNCIFYDCTYSIKGMKENKEPFSIGPVHTPKEKPVSFLRDIENQLQGNVINWKYLKITVSEPQKICILF